MAENNNNIQEGEGVKRVCGLPPRIKYVPEVIGGSLSDKHKAFVLDKAYRWANGSRIKYYFEKETIIDPKDLTVIINAFKEWQKEGISISFTEVFTRAESDIRIEFAKDDTAWSLIGKNCRDFPQEATMHFGWRLSDDYGRATALHEIGHALGLHHEHQNPNLKINWDEDAVIKYFTQTNGWDEETIRHNILDKIPPNSVFSSEWDPKSVMQYSFPPGLIKSPKPYDTQGISVNYNLSVTDKENIFKYYPPISSHIPLGNSPLLLGLRSGEEGTYSFTPSEGAGEYKINVKGDYEASIVVINSSRVQVGNDDNLSDGHAFVQLHLNADEEYIIHVRLNSKTPSSPDVDNDAYAILYAKKINSLAN